MIQSNKSATVRNVDHQPAVMSAVRRFPHPIVLLTGGVIVAALLTWVVPAGEYERRNDSATERSVAVAGTYHRVPANPAGLLQTTLAVPRGIVEAAEVIVVILFVGGTFALVERTGALARLVGAQARHTRHPVGILALVTTLFSTLGAIDNTHEEIIALVPVLVLLSRQLGYGAVTALGISVGAAGTLPQSLAQADSFGSW